MDADVQPQADTASQRLSFEGCGVSSDDVRIDAIEGREAISQPYRYETVLVSRVTLHAADFVGKRAKLRIDIGGDSLVVNGVVLEFQIDNPTRAGDFVYRVVLTPALRFLDFTTQNQIYGTETSVTLPDIIQMALDGGLLKQSSRSGGQEVQVQSEQRLTSAYPSRDHVVQYRESDLAFLRRSCEHAGVFFFFEQGDSSETVVFGDSNLAFSIASLPSDGLAYYRDHLTNAQEPVITSLRYVEKALPQRVYLSEYNDLLPSVELLSQADVAPDGFGVVVEYGQNFLTPNEGDNLAKVRAQEIGSLSRILHGESTAPQLRPGYVFEVNGHPDPTMDGRYIVTEITHEATTPFAPGQDSGVQHKTYRNVFQAIPFSVPFRPQRITPRPLAPGLYSGAVDGSGSGDRAEIDQYGRYKVRFFYDDGMSPDGQATEYIRKAQPYAGKNDSGMHFPLLKGTEVALAYINGDPDRPIILGALPNPLTPNVVTGSNSTRNRISSTTNVLFEIDDGPPGGGSAGSDPAGGMAPQNHYAMDAHAGEHAGQQGAAHDRSQALPLQNHHLTSPGGSDFSSATNYARISVPGIANSYLRLGVQADTDSTTWTTGLSTQLTTPTGMSGQPVTTATSAQDLYTSTPVTTHEGDGFANGILVGAADDLVVNVTGGNVNLVGTGVTTQVKTNDHYTNVQAGAFSVAASNGIYMNAGTNGGAETNIVLTASGYVKMKSEGDMHVYSSSNSYSYIDADSYTTIIGTKTQDVQGNNISTVEGNNISSITGTNTTTLMGAETVVKMGARFTTNLGVGIATNVALDMKFILGGEMSFQLPFAFKMVAGADLKFVWGIDLKMVTQDIKVVTAARYELQPTATTIAGATQNFAGLKTVTAAAFSDTYAARAGRAVLDVLDSGAQIMMSPSIVTL